MSFRVIVRWALVLALAGLFFLAGVNKISDKWNKERFAENVQKSHDFPKTWPLNQTGWSADAILLSIGLFEVVFAVIALCPHYVRLSALVFIGLLVLALTHYEQLGDHSKRPLYLGLIAASTLLFAVGAHVPEAAVKKAAAADKKRQ